jgi:uncharacterized protein (DUF433 family)
MSAHPTDEQLNDIRDRLAQGMTPDDIANFYGRVADLDLIEIERIRTAANELEQQKEHHQGENP